ncbi:MAG: hypothetical protein IJV14_05250 [Lachnospiraceae bacterium]|nr:hypothetical protein [Lachnospiraceae bacterium]
MKALTLKQKAKKKAFDIATLAYVGAMSGLAPVFAGETDGGLNITGVTINDSGNTADTFVASLAGIVMKVAQYGGVVLMLWGAVMFGFAIKNDEPESKQKALMCAIAGVVLFFLRSILQGAGIITTT